MQSQTSHPIQSADDTKKKTTSVVPSQTTVNTAKLVKINSNLPQTGEEASTKVSLLGAILAAIGLSGLGITWRKKRVEE
ncbi:LPXTG cell wall anchor domain-containing protein [Ligilactobacillus saerimneri]|uniref:LPXTG cell wall anchor domain-containing protein n=1 Tax=Ligilactobacillus saerimneri TaxID=228229 RepID=UPI0009D966A1